MRTKMIPVVARANPHGAPTVRSHGAPAAKPHGAPLPPLHGAPAALLAALCVAALLLTPASLAHAYFNRGTVGISVGAASVSLTPGQSTSVSVTLNPASDEQTQGCGMAECPQSCGDKGCLDANGQCVCAGQGYSTYYPDVAVSSSNGGVATASYSGGALSITAVGEGSCTLTLTASLRQFSSGSTSISVTVSGGGGSGNGASGGSSGTTNNTNNTNSTNTSTGDSQGAAGTSQDSVGSGYSPGAVSATDAGVAQASPDAAAGAGAETVVDMNGWIVHLVPMRAGTDAAAKLSFVAGTDEEMTLWYGGTVDHPDYSWTFQGAALDSTALATAGELDLGITVSARGTGLVASLLEGSDKTLVLDFAHFGSLPAPAVIYVAAPAYLREGQALSLYLYDEQAGTFVKRLDGLSVESGYIAFEIDHCSTWAVSADDLSALSVAALPDALNPVGGGVGSTADGALLGLPIPALIAVGAAAVAALAAFVFARIRARRRQAAVAGDDTGADDTGADDTGAADGTEADDTGAADGTEADDTGADGTGAAD
ncbi:MAG: hypothetical protein LBP28_03805, partial [Coriobacteriales bacterium]|nr:hypothetical protein [Coriobacteriales bacterium]